VNNNHIPKLTEMLCGKIVQLFQMVHNDVLNGGLLKDIIKYFSEHQDGYSQLIQVFLPYIAEILEFKLNGGLLEKHLDLGASTEDYFLSVIKNILYHY